MDTPPQCDDAFQPSVILPLFHTEPLLLDTEFEPCRLGKAIDIDIDIGIGIGVGSATTLAWAWLDTHCKGMLY